LAVTAKVQAIAGADMLAEFHHAFTHGLSVAKIARFKPPDPQTNPCLCGFVADGRELLGHWLLSVCCLVPKDRDHVAKCSLKDTVAQRDRRESSPGVGVQSRRQGFTVANSCRRACLAAICHLRAHALPGCRLDPRTPASTYKRARGLGESTEMP
jgi:hypothetical protein